METSNHTETLGKYKILKELGSGLTADVKLAIDTETGHKVAVKILRDLDYLDYFKLEIAALQNLRHPNILNMIESGADKYVKNGKDRQVHYIVMEYACNGELFDIVAKSSSFSEEDTRFIFSQLLDVLIYIHESGYAHLDIKLENILVNSKCELKLADFGFSRRITDEDGEEIVQTQFAGTKDYMAPEFHNKKKPLEYSGRSADLFAAAVALFTIKSQHPPWESAKKHDNWYRYIMAAESRKEKGQKYLQHFWKMHEKNHDPGFYSEDFKRFFEAMVNPEPSKRATLEELVEFDWI